MIDPQARFATPDLEFGFAHFGGFEAPLSLQDEYVVVDVETTSFDARTGRIIEFAAHRTRGDGSVSASFSTLIDPETLDTGAVHIHGITPDMVNGAPTWQQVAPAIHEFMGNAIFVAHHAIFDASFIFHSSKRVGIEIAMMPAMCTVWLARQAFPQLPKHNLETVSDHLGIVNDLSHAASSDAQVVVRALPLMLSEIDEVRHYIPTSGVQLALGAWAVKNRPESS